MTALVLTDDVGRHGQLQAIKGLSLSIAEGEVVAVIGAAGAGRTTLVRMIAGLHGARCWAASPSAWRRRWGMTRKPQPRSGYRPLGSSSEFTSLPRLAVRWRARCGWPRPSPFSGAGPLGCNGRISCCSWYG
jgi:hypothetical protein